jgi:hypothetical protein
MESVIYAIYHQGTEETWRGEFSEGNRGNLLRILSLHLSNQEYENICI